MNSGKKISVAAMTAILVAAGYGGYTLIKEKDLEALRTGAVATYTVVRVIDGDTLELSDGDVVRMLAIDAPEQGECHFEEAKMNLEKLVLGKKIELREDVTKTDDFGRLLRYVILPDVDPLVNNVLVNEWMVASGSAEPMSSPRDKLYAGILLEAREEAERESRGMWRECGEFNLAPSEHGQRDVEATSSQCSIKGNISTGVFGKTYFLPGCNNYNQVKIDPDRGEEYFCTEALAIKAGYVKSSYCP